MDDAEGRGASLMHGAASLLLLAFSSASPCQTTPASPMAPTVKVGKEFKKTTGLVKELQNGDVSCVIVLQDEDGKEFMESGDFDICIQKPSLIGKYRKLLNRLVANIGRVEPFLLYLVFSSVQSCER